MPDNGIAAEGCEDLVERASRVLERLRQDTWKRPLFIEFAGTPKSGKSSTIDSVAHFFRRLDYRVLAPSEGASKRTPWYLKDDLAAYNTWSACYALRNVLEGRYDAEKHEIVILDRGLFDALVWFDLLTREGQIEREFCESVQSFLLIDKWRMDIDLVLLFKVGPESSMERENRAKLVKKTGRAMNPQFLEKLNASYDSVRESYSDLFANFAVIDTGEEAVDEREAARQVADLTLGILESTFDEE